MTNIATVGAIGTYWRAVGEEEEISVRCDLVPTFGTLEAVDVKERLAKGNDEPALFVDDRVLATWTEPVLQREGIRTL